MDFKTFERNTRDASYEANLSKEAKITKVFTDWCDKNGWAYRINPTDSELNLRGSDITIGNKTTGRRLHIDLKGCMSRFPTVALSYERSYDGVHWNKVFDSSKVTNYYCFICVDSGDIGFLSKDEIVANLANYKKTESKPGTSGHYQRLVLIDKADLKPAI